MAEAPAFNQDPLGFGDFFEDVLSGAGTFLGGIGGALAGFVLGGPIYAAGAAMAGAGLGSFFDAAREARANPYLGPEQQFSEGIPFLNEAPRLGGGRAGEFEYTPPGGYELPESFSGHISTTMTPAEYLELGLTDLEENYDAALATRDNYLRGIGEVEAGLARIQEMQAQADSRIGQATEAALGMVTSALPAAYQNLANAKAIPQQLLATAGGIFQTAMNFRDQARFASDEDLQNSMLDASRLIQQTHRGMMAGLSKSIEDEIDAYHRDPRGSNPEEVRARVRELEYMGKTAMGSTVMTVGEQALAAHKEHMAKNFTALRNLDASIFMGIAQTGVGMMTGLVNAQREQRLAVGTIAEITRVGGLMLTESMLARENVNMQFSAMELEGRGALARLYAEIPELAVNMTQVVNQAMSYENGLLAAANAVTGAERAEMLSRLSLITSSIQQFTSFYQDEHQFNEEMQARESEKKWGFWSGVASGGFNAAGGLLGNPKLFK